MSDIVELRELSVDFIQNGDSANGNPAFEAKPAASLVTTGKGADILLDSVDKVKSFVDDMSKIRGDVFLCAGKYVIDAKSIMGIFSLELSKPLRLEFENWKEEYGTVIERYLPQ